jgi:hypothetical protein
MADLSSHPDFDLDTALSADLDGELDAYAAELGVTPDDVRAAVSTPAGTARRAELAAVRTALGRAPDPGGELDDVTRRRLLAGAGVGSAPTRPARDRSFLLRSGAAAAITLVVVAGIYALAGNSDDSAPKTGGGAGASAATGKPPVSGDLGDLGVVDASTVAGLLRGAVPAPSATRSAPEASRDQAFASNTTGAGLDAGTAVSPQTVDACARQLAPQGTIRFRASGTYGGRPAVILGLDTDRRTIVFVVVAGDCTQVLYSVGR